MSSEVHHQRETGNRETLLNQQFSAYEKWDPDDSIFQLPKSVCKIEYASHVAGFWQQERNGWF